MKKIIMLLIAAMMTFAFVACDDGGTAKGSIEVTVTNNSTSDGVALIGVYSSLATMLAGDLPTLSNSATGDAVTIGSSVVVTISNVPVGEYYVTAILETDAVGATGFGDQCDTERAPYFMNDSQTYEAVYAASLGSGTSTTVSVTSGNAAAVSGTFTDAQLIPALACSK